MAETENRNLPDFVLFAYQPDPVTQQASGDGPGSIVEANALLARFLAPNADRAALARALQPSLADYRAIFEQSFADKAYEFFVPDWQNGTMIRDMIDIRQDQTELLVYAASSDRLRNGRLDILPGKYERVAGMIRAGITIYSWEFVKPGKKFGMAYDGLYYVNDHWVVIPCPDRIQDR
jgi:hypothetical protein